MNIEIIDGEGLPPKLCTKSFCQYEFYQTKDTNPNLKMDKMEEDTMSSDDDDDMDARMGGEDYTYAPKRKKKLFKTKTVE